MATGPQREATGAAGSIAVRAAEEYAYVARDVRRIAMIGGSLVGVLLIGILASPVQATGIGPAVTPRLDPPARRGPPRYHRRDMPATRRPSSARPEALFQPPPERQPLAARMRPRSLDEFVGQEHLVGERGLSAGASPAATSRV